MKNKRFIFHFIFILLSLSAYAEGNSNFDIKYQRCEWQLDPSSDGLAGKITYYFTTLNDHVQEIELNLQDNMTVDAVTQRNASIPFTHSNNLIQITLSDILNYDMLDSVSVEYHGIPNGSGFGSYVKSQHNGFPIVWTLSEPFGAEDWFPCKNDLTDKVDSIDIFVTVPNGNKVASNGILVSVTQTNDNQNTHHWKMRYPVASYLIAFAVTNYESYSDWLIRDDSDKLEILNYVYPENLEKSKIQTQATIPIMQFFEEKFGRYPFSDEKYGHAQFDWGGGMEHQTMSFMVNFNYSLIAHELAHQWFGDMITCGSWHDVWLNEGFATYCTALYQEKAYPDDWNLWKNTAISIVTSEPDGSVYRYQIPNSSVILNNRLTYQKAGFVLHMLRWVLGDEHFFQGIRNYINDPNLQYGFAFTDDLKKYFEYVSEKDLTYFFDTWIYKEGYPEYNVEISQSDIHNATVTIRQTPSHPSVACFNMPVPIQIIGNKKDEIVVFENSQTEQTFTFDPGFEIIDAVFDPEHWLLCKYQMNCITCKMNNYSPITIYPNPAKDYVNISMNSADKTQWTLTDVLGNVLQSGIIQNQFEFIIITSGLPTGTYLLNITQGTKITMKKLLVLTSQ